MKWRLGQDHIIVGLIGEQLKDQEGGRSQTGQNPNENEYRVRLRNARLPPGGVNDELMSFQGDEDKGQHGHRHRYALDERHQATQQRPKHPVIHDRVYDSERQAEDAHQNVRE